jgi:tRNA pseudouridine13 synthase
MIKPPPLDLSLPYLTADLEGIGGRIRARPEDFMVEEIALYEPSGSGRHLYVNITKRSQTTRDVQLQLAELFDLRPRNIGTAGLKDKHAVTTQTFSILFEKNDVRPDDASTLIEGSLNVKVNWAKFHGNKLRAGHLIGNRFKITITDIRMPPSQAIERSRRIAETIHLKGLPNYYGEQRIGKDGKKVREGWAILQGRKTLADRWLGKLLVSVYRSYLCNRYLAERMRRGLFDRLLLGDIAKKHETGGIFWVNDPSTEQPRYEAQEISFTAPIYGYKMSQPLGEAATLEAEIFNESETSMETFKRMKVTGTRRFGRLTPRIEVTEAPRGIQLSFMLHKGGFATTLLREFMKTEQGTHTR